MSIGVRRASGSFFSYQNWKGFVCPVMCLDFLKICWRSRVQFARPKTREPSTSFTTCFLGQGSIWRVSTIVLWWGNPLTTTTGAQNTCRQGPVPLQFLLCFLDMVSSLPFLSCTHIHLPSPCTSQFLKTCFSGSFLHLSPCQQWLYALPYLNHCPVFSLVLHDVNLSGAGMVLLWCTQHVTEWSKSASL